MTGLIELDEGQLRRLSKLIRDQEIQRINDVQFGSEYERVNYIRDCRANYDMIEALLDNAAGLVNEQKSDQTKSPIANDVYDQVKGLVNQGLQGIRNYTVRKEFLNKVVAHADDAMKQLRLLDPANEANVRRLAKDAQMFKDAIKNFNAKHASIASKLFSDNIKEQGISFEELIIRYKHKRGLSGPFKELSEEDKFLVYEDIIKDSGRGQIIDDGFAQAEKDLKVGLALLTFVAGIMVWDIFSSSSTQMLEKAMRDMADIATNIGGSMLGDFVAAALMDTELAVIEGAAMMVTVAGFIAGAAAGFLLAALAGLLLDTIFSSGGQVPSTQGFQIFVAPMPDGEKLARQIAHD